MDHALPEQTPVSRPAPRVPLRFTTGDATRPTGPGTKIIGHLCNDEGRWGAGFVLQVSQRWPEPEHAFRAWHGQRSHNDFGLGAVQLVEVAEDSILVANMIGQRGIRNRRRTDVPIRYDAVEQCLMVLADHALTLKATVHLPRIGTGLAGGQWRMIEPLITGLLCDRGIATTVYDRA